MKRLVGFWSRRRTATLPDGTYRLRKSGEGKFELGPLSAAEEAEADGTFHYWAIVDRNYPVTAPWTLVRQQGYRDERECFNGHVWSRTDIMNRIRWGREDREAVLVSAEQAEQITRFLVERWESVQEPRTHP
ncbi:hypothetical protein ABJI51_35325 [Amycolatopsis sp. NEAU-NG30]|uniref:Uncharacterized protein n=1 Tax=Amycolatopsis melonis TaxID=3156488 RepID=A0ABV0LPZ2_9PSEU